VSANTRSRLLNLFAAFALLLSYAAWALGDAYWRDPPPFGWLALGCLAYFVWRIVASVRSHSELLRRMDKGLCRACGYDLRGITGRCPECGREIKPHEGVRLKAGGD
jgi:hypothetical protein